MAHVDYLASERLEGRGVGTQDPQARGDRVGRFPVVDPSVGEQEIEGDVEAPGQ